MAYVIVKYASQLEEGEKVSKSLAYDGYTCELANVEKSKVYVDYREANMDLLKLFSHNPTVDYGVCETFD